MYIETDFPQLFTSDVLEPLPGAVHVFVDFHGRFLHDGVGFFAAADERVIMAAGQAHLPVRSIETNAQKRSRFTLTFGMIIRSSHCYFR